MFEELLGPALCNKLLCLLGVFAVMGIGMFAQPLLTMVQPAITFAQALGMPLAWAIYGPVLAVFIAFCACICICIRKARRFGTGD